MQMTLKATQILPTGYLPAGKVDLRQPWKLLLVNILALGLLAVFGALFYLELVWLRPDQVGLAFSFDIGSLVDGLLLIAVLLGLLAVMIVLHEALHGICFWAFTGARPKFAFKGAYAYAALPDWYFPKWRYLVIALAPLVGITLLGSLLMLVLNGTALAGVWFVMVNNAAGAAGDLVVAGWLLFLPADTLVRDQGDAVEFFRQSNKT